MISVVIPTMWRHAPFCDFLTEVCACDHVQDVVLIDNAARDRPLHDVLTHDKIKLLNFGENLFVNASWNVGVYHSQAQIICLQNDDIQFDCAIYQKVHEFLQPHMGLISLSSEPPQSDAIEFRLWQGESQFGCGQLMFFHRKQFVCIDPELRVYCGDNWLFDHMWHMTRNNHMIHNLTHHTPYAQTSKSFRHLLHAEQLMYAEICAKLDIPQIHV
jgi:hypothetical protein